MWLSFTKTLSGTIGAPFETTQPGIDRQAGQLCVAPNAGSPSRRLDSSANESPSMFRAPGRHSDAAGGH